MSIIYNDIAALVLALDRISAVSAAEAVKRIHDGIRRGTVKICCSSCIQGVSNIVASRDLKLYADPLFVIYHDIKFRKSVIENDILRNKISLSACHFAYFAIRCTCNYLRESSSRLNEIILCFNERSCNVPVVT